MANIGRARNGHQLIHRVRHGIIIGGSGSLQGYPSFQQPSAMDKQSVMHSVSRYSLPNLNKGVKVDAAHLRDSLTKPDLVLCTTDGGVTMELPAHAKLLSKHSRVLSEMITACNEPRIYMVGDKLSELKAMLSIMYRPECCMTSGQLLAALSIMHKYDMQQAKSDVESQLVANVKHAVRKDLTDQGIVRYVAASEKFELRELRACSEAYIAMNFEKMGKRQLLLSRESLARIALALAKRSKSATADIDSLVEDLEEATERHAEYEAVIIEALLSDSDSESPDCPGKKCKGQICLKRTGKRPWRICCSERRCRWAAMGRYSSDSGPGASKCFNDLLERLLSM